MDMRKLGILILFVLVFVSFNFVSASDICFDGNNSQVEGDIVAIDSDNMPITQSGEDVLQDSSNSQSSSTDDYIIYVGTNSTPNGLGTKENPFSTFDLACQNVNDGEKKSKVTINVFNGTYSIGSYLKFNTDNLNINATEGSVVLKNLYNDQKQSFGLTAPGNFIMSNVIVDASDYHPKDPHYDSGYWFTPFVGNSGNTILFDNCTFTGFETPKEILPIWEINDNNDFIFNYCKFISSTGQKFGWFGDFGSGGSVTFNYCVFSALFETIGLEYATNVVFDSCWLGHNNGYTGTFFSMMNYNPDDLTRYNGFMYRMPFLKNSLFANRHAVLDVSENYLGDNTYEILGKLMWNDGTEDNIDKLGSMTVYLSADNGEIPTTATLENGTFKVTYTSETDYHEIAVVLDSQKIKLNNKINFTLDNPTINYGDNQNITVTFPSNVNGTVYVTVNNKTYHKYVDDQNSVTVSIDDTLTKGNYPVDVSFVYDKNEFDVVDNRLNSGDYAVEEIDSFGFNTTKLTVKGFNDYEFNSTVTPNSLYIGDNATVTLSLPDGANGTVTIKVGDNEAKTFNVNETIAIDGFVAGDNVVNITYNGNDIFDAKSVVKTVAASTKPTALAASDVTTTYNVTKELVITLTSNGDALAGKKINVVVGSINENLTTNASGQVSIDISSLTPDTYTASIAFAGDDLYNKSSTTAKVTVKEEIKTNITVPEITAGKATTTTITLPQNATGNITVTVDGKEYSVVNLTNGSATVTIPELPAGKHNVTITYSGDGNYSGFTQTSTVEIKEPAKPTTNTDSKPATVKKTATKITAKKKTFKAKVKVKKYTITLKAGKKAVKKVQVTLKIGKKTYKAKTNAKGKATFKIKKLTKKGKYTAKITFRGNKLYKASSKKVKITVKK